MENYYPISLFQTNVETLPLVQRQSIAMYNITGHVAGIFPDYMQGLQQRLNFTAELFVRQDRKYGNLENGNVGFCLDKSQN